uniref:Uncharacterized protein n=1 Tax=Rhizophagus irregularis (strain DAOM 181602 / DAOM 197198 / MUCL 43194) TaxID=747089 RepID=U9TI61_RHIID
MDFEIKEDFGIDFGITNRMLSESTISTLFLFFQEYQDLSMVFKITGRYNVSNFQHYLQRHKCKDVRTTLCCLSALPKISGSHEKLNVMNQNLCELKIGGLI